MLYLDTHAAVWLYAGEMKRFPRRARRLIESNPLRVSPMAVLEAQYLFEIGKITQPASTIIQHLEQSVGLELCLIPFGQVIQESLALDWTRDPFDRLIVAQARVAGAQLLTRDEMIRQHEPNAVWD